MKLVKLKKLNTKKLDCFYYWNYWPKRFEIDPINLNIRKTIWKFKDGKYNPDLIEILARTLNNPENIDKSDFIIIPIPASTKEKHIKRYEEFLKEVSKNSNIINGYSAIEIAFEKEARHISNVRTYVKNYIIHSSMIKGKNVILFDDVITSGTSFLMLAKDLFAQGALSVSGIFFGKTASDSDYEKIFKQNIFTQDEMNKNTFEYFPFSEIREKANIRKSLKLYGARREIEEKNSHQNEIPQIKLQDLSPEKPSEIRSTKKKKDMKSSEQLSILIKKNVEISKSKKEFIFNMSEDKIIVDWPNDGNNIRFISEDGKVHKLAFIQKHYDKVYFSIESIQAKFRANLAEYFNS